MRILILVAGLWLAAANAFGAGVAVRAANNGSDFASPLLTASNIASITISNQAQLPALPNLSGITGKYPGQPLVTYGGGAGGGGLHTLYFWNSQGGASNWDGGLQIPGPLVASSSGVGNHLLIVSNGTDNVLELKNLDPAHYSAVRFTDLSGNEKGAIGYGNTSAAFYPGINYFEDFGILSGIYFVGNGKLFFGSEASTGDFVRYKSTATNAALSNVVARIDSAGALKLASGIISSNGATSLGLVSGGIAPLSISADGTTLNIFSFSTANAGTANFSRMNLNYDPGSASIPCNGTLNFGSSGWSFGGTGNNVFEGGFCFGTVTTNFHCERVLNAMYLQNAVRIGSSNNMPTSVLQVDGPIATGMNTQTANYTATAFDSTILINGATKTITLPTAVGCIGRIYTIKLIAAATTGTVGTTSSQNIDGATTYSLSAQYKYVTVQSNGTQWWIIANN